MFVIYSNIPNCISISYVSSPCFNISLRCFINFLRSAFDNSTGGTALLMSSKGEEYSLEDQGLRQGIFSHYLIRGLKGEADKNKNKIVTIQELYDFVFKKVRNYTKDKCKQTNKSNSTFKP